MHARTHARTHTHIDVTEAHCNALYDTNGEAQTAEKGLCGWNALNNNFHNAVEAHSYVNDIKWGHL